MARSYFLIMPFVTLGLVACGKFASDPAASRLSTAANPLQAEREDLIKLAARKEVPTDVAALFSKERAQSDAALSKQAQRGGLEVSKLRAAVAVVSRLDVVLLKRRSELLRLFEINRSGRTLSNSEGAWLVSLSNEFKAKAGNLEDLKQRVDVWPVSFVLGSMLVGGNSWPTEAELSDRLTVLNTSNKTEFIAVRALRSRLAGNTLSGEALKSDREKLRVLVEELTKGLVPSQRSEMLKMVLDISTELEFKVVGEKL